MRIRAFCLSCCARGSGIANSDAGYFFLLDVERLSASLGLIFGGFMKKRQRAMEEKL